MINSLRWEDIWQSTLGWSSKNHSNSFMPNVPDIEERPKRPEDIRAYLKSRSSRRWKRINRDLRWMEKELKKIGLNPEDARWYL